MRTWQRAAGWLFSDLGSAAGTERGVARLAATHARGSRRTPRREGGGGQEPGAGNNASLGRTRAAAHRGATAEALPRQAEAARGRRPERGQQQRRRGEQHQHQQQEQQQRRREEPRQLDSSSGHRSGRPRAGSAGPPGGSRGGRRGTRPGHAAQGPRPLAGTFPSRGLRGVPAVRGDTGSRLQPRPRASLPREESRRDACAGVLPLRPPNWRRAFRAAGPASASD